MSLEGWWIMNRKEYQQYLQTEHWRNVRLARLEKDEYRCSLCGERDNLQVHHWTYDRLGDEGLDDVVTLCGRCHNILHIAKKTWGEQLQAIQNDYHRDVETYKRKVVHKYHVQLAEKMAELLRSEGVTSGYSTNRQQGVYERMLRVFFGINDIGIGGLPRLMGILAGKKKFGKANTVEEWRSQWLNGGRK